MKRDHTPLALWSQHLSFIFIIPGERSAHDNSYVTVVLRLLEKWVAGDIDLDIEPDPEFVASAHEAFRTEAVQKALQQLGEHYDANRTYPNAVKA
jgi:hypothetical protein